MAVTGDFVSINGAGCALLRDNITLFIGYVKPKKASKMRKIHTGIERYARLNRFVFK